MTRGKWLLSLGVALALLACDDDDDNCNAFPGDGGRPDGASLDGANTVPDAARPDAELADGAIDGASSDGSVSDVGLTCTQGRRYTQGTPIFVERTAEWGLSALAVEGVRLSVGDIDGDGLPDVVVRRGAGQPEVFSGEHKSRNTWVLKNTGHGFEDVTEASGFLAVRGRYPVAIGRPVEVVAFGDVDNDGDLDAYTGLDSRTALTAEGPNGEFEVHETSELLINDGTGHFELTTANDPLRRASLEDIPSGASFADVNRDGNLDLWLTQGGAGAPRQDRLFKSDEDGAFKDVTAAMGLTTAEWDEPEAINEGGGHSTAWSATTCDLNGDGYPELLAGSYGRAPNHLWQGSAEGFINRSVASGYAYDENLTWQGDQFARCYCAANPDAEGCGTTPEPQIECGSPNWDHSTGREPYRLGGNSATAVCVDFNNDGHLDLFTTEIKHWWAGEGADAGEVLVNTGEADVRLTRPGRAATGLAMSHSGSWDEGHMTAAALDFDNDGRQDLYLGASDYPGNRGHLYHNVSEGEVRFEEVPIGDFFEHNRSHGVAVADFDQDGDLDLLVGHSRARCGAPNDCYATQQVRAFENIMGQDAHWLQLDLRGKRGTNRLAVGARVTVETEAGVQTQEVQGGFGHFGAQTDRVLHFGLADACTAKVIIRWPDGSLSTQTLEVEGVRRYKVTQGQAPEAQF